MSDGQQPGPSRRVTSPIEQPSGSLESREERSDDLNQPGPSNAKQGSQPFPSDNRQPKSRSSNQGEEEERKTQDQKINNKYQKRPGTSDIEGHFYEINLLTLARLRGSIKTDRFFLAVNMAGVGAFDDLVLKYWNSDDEKEILIFLQAKYKNDPKKYKVTIDKFKTGKKDNNYYLKKYLLDYLKIKKRFDVKSKDPLFRGNFKELDCHFVIYTNSILDEKFNENMINDIDNNIILSTKESGKAFKFRVDSTENNDLINMLVDVAKEEQIKSLAKILVEYICKENPENMMGNEFFQAYHIFLSQNVIEVQKEVIEEKEKKFRIGKFRDDFLKTGEKNVELLERFRKEIFYEYAERVVFNDKLENNKEGIQDLQVEQVANLLKFPKQINDVEIIKKLAAARALVLDKERRQVKFVKSSNNNSVNQIIEKFENEIDGLADYLFDCLIEAELAKKELKLHVDFGNINPILYKPPHLAEQVVRLFEEHRSKKVVPLFEEHKKVVKISDDMIAPNNLTYGDIKNIAKLIGNLLILDKETGILKLPDRKDLEENVQEFIEALRSKGLSLSNEELYTYRFDIKVKNFPRFSLVNEDKVRSDVKEFLSKLEIFTGQANNEELEEVIKDEMRNFYQLTEEEVNQNFPKIQTKVKIYWQEEGKSSYLEKDDFFENDILRINVNLPERLLTGPEKEAVKIVREVKRVVEQAKNIERKTRKFFKKW